MSDTWSYDPGYRPDDPRHGLSPKGLVDFYNSRPKQWMIRCIYGSKGLERRESAMQAHRDFYAKVKDRVFFLGPVLADDGKTPIGSFVIIEAKDRADAEAFIAGEGFVQFGMIDKIEIKRFVETSLNERRQLEMSHDPSLQLFLCEMIDGPDGAEKRKTAGPAHHQYQKRVMDSFLCRGPMRSDDGLRNIGTFYIIQVKDRAAAEAFIAAEPLNQAGIFSEIRINRWRFGGALTH
jgi:uncharacterized protein YciI